MPAKATQEKEEDVRFPAYYSQLATMSLQKSMNNKPYASKIQSAEVIPSEEQEWESMKAQHIKARVMLERAHAFCYQFHMSKF